MGKASSSPSRDRDRRRRRSRSGTPSKKRQGSADDGETRRWRRSPEGKGVGGREKMRGVIEELKGEYKTRWVDVSDAGLDDDDAKELAEALEKYGDDIKALYIHNNQFSNAGMKTLMKAVEECPQLHMVNIANNPCSDAVKEDFMAVIASKCKNGRSWKGENAMGRRGAGRDGRDYARKVMESGEGRRGDRGRGRSRDRDRSRERGGRDWGNRRR
eukprot:Hpha_TRINITY_DN10748_c0_g1::TRINITY_DN10748_c0_g1_i1::g.43496::m.43496